MLNNLQNVICAKYPFYITAFRRALDFTPDKEAISDEVWEGLSQPLDPPVPATKPFPIEGLLPYTYYEANVALGNRGHKSPFPFLRFTR